MNQRDIFITEFDLARLRDVLRARISAGGRDRDHLESLEHELDRAHVVDPAGPLVRTARGLGICLGD